MSTTETANSMFFSSKNGISLSSSAGDKYGGLFKQSFFKSITKGVAFLFDYVYSVAPSYPIMHAFTTVVRILQLAGPAFCVAYVNFWENEKEQSQTVVLYLSIAFHLIPVQFRENGGFFYIIIYMVIFIISFLLTGIMAKVYQQSASIPKFLPIMFAIFYSTFGYLMHPITFELVFGQLSRLIFSESSFGIGLSIGLIIVVVIVAVLYMYQFFILISQTLTFRDDSLKTLCPITQSSIFIITIIITSILSVGEYSGKSTQGIFMIIGGLFYIAAIPIGFWNGGIINRFQCSVYAATCVSSCLFCFAGAVTNLLNKQASLAYIVAYLIVWVLALIGSNLIIKKTKVSHIQIMDQILDETSTFDNIKSPNKFMSIAVTGFETAHPVCLNLSFFKQATEKWENNGRVWYVYAKFISIYPECTQVLGWIYHMVTTNKIKSIEVKTIKTNSLSIARLREAHLSPDLKQKLSKAIKKVISSKHKLRNVWDLAIQGNTGEMDNSTRRAIKEIEHTDSEMLHILRQFPNNRFVTRTYARFCRELKADLTKSNEYIEKSKILLRGLNVNSDQAHEEGMRTFRALPPILNDFAFAPHIDTSTSIVDMDFEDEVSGEIQSHDEKLILISRIDDLKIPSMTNSIKISSLIYLILFLLPTIVLIVLARSYVSSLSKPLEHIFNIAELRSHVFMLEAVSIRRIHEVLKSIAPPYIPDDEDAPVSMGKEWETLKQLSHMVSSVGKTLQNLESFRATEFNDPEISAAKSLMFDPDIPYNFYTTQGTISKNITMQSAISDYMLQQTTLINGNETTINYSVWTSSVLLNPFLNIDAVLTRMNNAMTHVNAYVDNYVTKNNHLYQLIMYIVVVVTPILYIIVYILQIKWVNNDKERVYSCLTALPKNVVSTLAENLRVLKNDAENSSTNGNNNTEVNKQEDNILKTFFSGGSNTSMKAFDIIVITICMVISLAMHLLVEIFIVNLFIELGDVLRRNSPHIDNIHGANAMIFAAQMMVYMMMVEDGVIPLVNKALAVIIYTSDIVRVTDYLHNARYGKGTENDTPYRYFMDAISSTVDLLNCTDPTKIPKNFLQYARCMEPDSIALSFQPLWNSQIFKYSTNENVTKLSHTDELTGVWYLLIKWVYDKFLYQIILTLINLIDQTLLESVENQQFYIIIFTAIGLVSILILIILNISINHHLKNVLKLLLHVPSQYVLNTTRIMEILDGNFNQNKLENKIRDIEFFHDVVKHLPDIVIVFNAEHKIENVNESITSLLGIDKNDVIGKTASELFDSRWSGELCRVLSPTMVVNNSNNNHNNFVHNPKKNDIKCNTDDTQDIIRFTKNDELITLEAVVHFISNQKVIVMSDKTQTVRYNTLINEEKSKSDFLLSSILPFSLVKRVQNGEENISFGVQSATIVFMDIVSFTPWCGSLPASQVMSTLNLLFKKFDANCGKYTTMTKIKCIGDCYMAAGGIFAEINKPVEHAREVVSFGLDSINSVKELNQEINESIKIRVGVNVGGPLVAGVLGIGKPTFEILGPAINMAQQMEHHGVPMQVHISRLVYELIYGGTFIIKERGPLEVKGGTVTTYLVIPEDDEEAK
ncbi:Adenylate and Guanylate cyclase catalytic domain containing protein [Tritrichomonas foetus]|uniref:Adenylate and Guanylate cyclase catalytic domain containing protein n=1 Tax=Tritrichomonas foetus TaxID=1144522 RepID=A0A1J4K2R1_9EUKA|nr:Adenylate and Guanylate cyclase catalytic domain containing protein [Tritrichomonas foetus]|eukprot:OHT05258.1 Adenylate and Guanylate cyclase catalytic domain containing protein [Tritrichomonas foetus]